MQYYILFNNDGPQKSLINQRLLRYLQYGYSPSERF